jgi:hypothetical protein
MARKGRLTNQERDRIKNDALGLFIRGYSLQSISEMETIQIQVGTLRKWAKEGDWEERKRLENISPSEIKAMILKNVAAIKSGKAMPYKPDDISKLASAWEKMDDVRKRAVYAMEAFSGFADWMLDRATKASGKKRKATIDRLQLFRELQDEYLNTLLE